MYYTYFVSVITTIEKLFQIQSKTTGIIMSATEIGQIGSSLLLTYYGGQGHRPKWIAWGMILFAVSSFTCSMPHFIFGEQLIHQNSSDPIPAHFCSLQDRLENSTFDRWSLIFFYRYQRNSFLPYGLIIIEKICFLSSSKLELIHDTVTRQHDAQLRGWLVDRAEDTKQDNHRRFGYIFRLFVGGWNGSNSGLHPGHSLHRR